MTILCGTNPDTISKDVKNTLTLGLGAANRIREQRSQPEKNLDDIDADMEFEAFDAVSRSSGGRAGLSADHQRALR
jgi:hypothetical protein